MSTVPDVVIDKVRSPSILSVAVAPGSKKESPGENLKVEEPVRVITGGVVSFTITVLTIEDELPVVSDTK